jgi:hypothetical protein
MCGKGKASESMKGRWDGIWDMGYGMWELGGVPESGTGLSG